MSRSWGEKTYREVTTRARDRLVAILPLGAVEAHGPHLPLVTDGLIAEAMAAEGARRLELRGLEALVLPTQDYSAAPFAREFAGTVSVRPAEELTEMGVRVAFPDLTLKPWALRLTEEFKSGACHAGRYETSVVLACRPDLVRGAIRRTLVANPRSLAQAIREGKKTFSEAGGGDAYFGAPAEATPGEGRDTISELGAILEDAVLQSLSAGLAS
jgi:creatinine amidohydrolase